jgi:hypothetical protein
MAPGMIERQKKWTRWKDEKALTFMRVLLSAEEHGRDGGHGSGAPMTGTFGRPQLTLSTTTTDN